MQFTEAVHAFEERHHGEHAPAAGEIVEHAARGTERRKDIAACFIDPCTVACGIFRSIAAHRIHFCSAAPRARLCLALHGTSGSEDAAAGAQWWLATGHVSNLPSRAYLRKPGYFP